MSAGHTPGPWRVKYDADGDPDHIVSDRFVVAALVLGTGSSAANANLISAAPDLLAALELFVSDWANDQSPPRKVWIANAAIAKARGETP